MQSKRKLFQEFPWYKYKISRTQKCCFAFSVLNKKDQESFLKNKHSTLTCFVSLFHWVQSLPSSLSISRLGIYVGKRKNTVDMFCPPQFLVSVKSFTVCQFWPTQQRRTLFDFRQCKLLQHRLSMGHGILFISGKMRGTPSTGYRLPSKLRSEFLKCWLSAWTVITALFKYICMASS